MPFINDILTTEAVGPNLNQSCPLGYDLIIWVGNFKNIYYKLLFDIYIYIYIDTFNYKYVNVKKKEKKKIGPKRIKLVRSALTHMGHGT